MFSTQTPSESRFCLTTSLKLSDLLITCYWMVNISCFVCCFGGQCVWHDDFKSYFLKGQCGW